MPYLRSIPLQARMPAALIEGWNQALARILDSAMMDFGELLRSLKSVEAANGLLISSSSDQD
jgi:hypothetical protein